MGIDTGAREIVGVGACSLRDTFFGHPASVYTGTLEMLSRRLQVRGNPRRPLHRAKSRATIIPARRRRRNWWASIPGRARSSGIGACALRDTFFGHPASVYTGTPEMLSRRLQVRGNPRRPLHLSHT